MFGAGEILLHPGAVLGSVRRNMTLSDERRHEIDSTLRRCSDKTIEAGIRFQESRDPADAEMIIFGILERELPQGSTLSLVDAPGNSRLVDGLGMDSLSLMEAVMSIEDVLGVEIDNSELRKIATLDDLNAFVCEKLGNSGGNGSGGPDDSVSQPQPA